jgi:hypothetical protein
MDPHWDVEPEDPLPYQTLDDGPTDERASSDGDPGDRAPSAEGLATHCGWCGIDDQRQRQWHRYATADALQGARRDEQGNGGAQCAERRCDREHSQTGDEHASPSVSVTQRRPGEDGGSEGQRVRVDRPAQPLDSGAEFLVQGWQRRRHDERVEPHQKRGERTEDERPAPRGPQYVGSSAYCRHY